MKFERTLLSKAVHSAFVMSVLAGSQALAQNTVMEEVYVQGIRGSLERAMDIKRDAAGVVDAISAEEIGKFPDANLAESLQRITGVSINRVNGEGSQITVRGFGSQYNMVTMNGRTLPAGFTYAGGSGAGGSFGGATRAFDFANLASESVSGVEVYKTGRAAIASGGMGASVNIKTQRPLDYPGFQANIAGKLMHDTTVSDEGDDWTPEVSGLISWTDDDETFGFSLTASYSERDSGVPGAQENNWNIGVWDREAFDNDENNLYSWTRDSVTDEITATVINEPEDGQLYARPNDFRWSFSERHRERTNYQLTGQLRPVDNLTLTLDHTFAEVEYWEHRGEWTIWFANGSNANLVVFDDSPIATPVFYYETVWGKDMGYEQQLREQTNTLESTGINALWDVTDSLSLNFDFHSSSMDNQPSGPGDAGEIAISVGAPIGVTQWVDFSGDLPVGGYTWDDDGTNPDGTSNGTRGNGNGELDEGDFGTQQGRVYYGAQLMDIDEFMVDGKWDIDARSRLDIGIDFRQMEMTQQQSARQVGLGTWGVNNPGELMRSDGSSYIHMFNMYSPYEDYGSNLSAVNNGDYGQQVSDAVASGVNYMNDTGVGVRAYDVAELCRHTVDLYPGIDPNTNQEWLCAADTNYNQDNRVNEDISAFYVQYSVGFDIGSMPANVLAGVRYEKTELESISYIRQPLYRPWQDNNDFQVMIYDNDLGKIPAVVENDYNNTLPSIDFDIGFTDDLKGRFSVSKTMARPNYGTLYAAVSNFAQTDPTYYIGAQPTAQRQNPMLEPLESTNIDLSLEWYYDDASYVSLGWFQKDVENFISTGQIEETHYGIQDVSNGPRARAAVDELLDNGITPDNTLMFVMASIIDDPGVSEVIDQDTDQPYFSDPVSGDPGLTISDFYAYYNQDVPAMTARYGDMTFSDFAIDVAAAYDLHAEPGDPETVWLTSYPENNEDATIDGAEFAVQHFFGDTGFGVQANYTLVDGDVEFDDLALPSQEQFALLGLSDTANLVLIYEKYGLRARLAWNWRDEFLRQTNQGGSRNPVYVDEYNQLDVSVSYDVTDNVNVFLEGLNLTEENVRWHQRSDRMTRYLEDLGARYQVGARVTF